MTGSNESPSPSPRPLRLTVCEPALARYRVPTWRELASRPGIDFHLEYTSDGHVPNVEPDGFSAHYTPSRPLWKRPELFWHPGTLRTMDHRPADVLVLNWNIRNISVWAAIAKARARRLGVVLFGHGVSKNDSWMRRSVRNALGGMGDCLLVYSESVRSRLLDEGFDPQRVFVAPNSVDQTDIQRARLDWLARPDDLAAFRREHKLDEGGPVLIFCARLEPLRRLDLLLDAMPRVAERHPGVRLIVIGGSKDAAFEAELRAKATGLGALAERVRFLGAIYGEPSLAPWFLSSDLMVFPSHMGLSVLHAMGYGVPVLTCDNASRHGPEFDVIQNAFDPGVERPNGATFADADLDALVDRLDNLLSDRERLRLLSAHALATATDDYSIPRMVDGFVAAARYAFERARWT